MTRHDNIMAVLQRMGFSPQRDEDGDIYVKFQMKTIYVFADDNDEYNYAVVLLPLFADVKDDDLEIELAVCNRITREMKLAKVFLDRTGKAISATCDFFYTDDQSLEFNLKMSLETLGIVRSQYQLIKESLLEQ